MGRVADLLRSLTGARRPPTGPLTTSEATEAEDSRLHALAEEGEVGHETPDAEKRTGPGTSE